jgi:hypothetical protein
MSGFDSNNFTLQSAPSLRGVAGSIGFKDLLHNLWIWVATPGSLGCFFGIGGVATPQSVLHIGGALQEPFVTKTAAYTLTAFDSTVAADTTSGAYNVTLPDATACPGRAYTIKRITATANTPTVACTGGQTIDGAATYALSAQWKFVSVVSNGANWLICGNN